MSQSPYTKLLFLDYKPKFTETYKTYRKLSKFSYLFFKPFWRCQSVQSNNLLSIQRLSFLDYKPKWSFFFSLSNGYPTIFSLYHSFGSFYSLFFCLLLLLVVNYYAYCSARMVYRQPTGMWLLYGPVKLKNPTVILIVRWSIILYIDEIQ